MKRALYLAIAIAGLFIFTSCAGSRQNSTKDRTKISWTDLNVPTSENIIRSASNFQGHLFASTRTGSIYRSLDSGRSWMRLLTEISSNETIAGFMATPEGTILAGTYSGNLYRSADNGTTWEMIINRWSPVLHLARDVRGTIFAACDDGILRSHDDGLTWERAGSEPPVQATFINVDTGDRIYACTRTSGLFRSADHGNSWQPLGEGVLVDTLESVAIDSDGSLFAITHSLLYRSTDDGNSWAAVKGLPRLLFHILATNSDNLFVGSYGNGLFLTTDKGLSWKKISDFSRIYSLAMDRDGFIYAAANDHLFRTSKSTYVSGSGGAIWADWSARVLLSMPPAPTE